MNKIVSNVCMVRKPLDLEEVLSTAKDRPSLSLEQVEVIKTMPLFDCEYDMFAQHPLDDYAFLGGGLGGYNEDGIRQVIKIIANYRPTLYVDPSGSSYGRYVGIEVEQ